MLREKLIAMYQMSKYRNVKDWRDSTKCQISEETVTKILNRGHEPAPYTFMIIAFHFGAPVAEIASAVKDAGAYELAALLTTASELSANEAAMLSGIRDLPADRQQTVAMMIEQLRR